MHGRFKRRFMITSSTVLIVAIIATCGVTFWSCFQTIQKQIEIITVQTLNRLLEYTDMELYEQERILIELAESENVYRLLDESTVADERRQAQLAFDIMPHIAGLAANGQ